jgi:hypothetical protein
LINPILRGWVNYFAVGHSSECFSFIQDWVEKKVRRKACATTPHPSRGIRRILRAGLMAAVARAI